jgi:8-oxo-dGTP pyrophosphatase MutT (NUDIX family)
VIPPDDSPNPWRRRSRRLAYENDWIEVFHDEVDRPDGSPGVYGVVHPRSVAVGVAAVDDEDRLLLVGQYRYTLDRWSWEIPEGGVPFDEHPLDGAKRELAEETGYRAETWRELMRTSLSNSTSDETGVVYVATGLTTGPPAPEATEELRVRWVPFSDAVREVRDGTIFDSITQIAVLRLALDRADGGAG